MMDACQMDTNRILNLNFDDLDYLDKFPSKRIRLDSNSLFEFVSDDENCNRIIEKRIKVEPEDNNIEKITAAFLGDSDDDFVPSEHDPLEFVNSLSEVVPDVFFNDDSFDMTGDEDVNVHPSRSEICDIIDIGNGYTEGDARNDGVDNGNGSSCSSTSSSGSSSDSNGETDVRDMETEVIIQFMQLEEPLTKLRKMLEESLKLDLADYLFYLQDVQKLDCDSSLKKICIKGEGLVQINLQLKIDCSGNKKINIIDVVKPISLEEMKESGKNNVPVNITVSSGESTKETKWIKDESFRNEQERHNIPEDPIEWKRSHVQQWLVWAVRKFNLKNVKLSDWHMDGLELSRLSKEDYDKKVPNDPGGHFWTHFELLRKCRLPATIEETSTASNIIKTKKIICRGSFSNSSRQRSTTLRMTKPKKILQVHDSNVNVNISCRTGNNGQIQLWQFLLDLLTDKNYRSVIQWLGNEGEFKLLNPEMVANLWGVRKNKPAMNYEKLSRALRYYYEGDMISKVPGKRFVYKFDCDLKSLLGYSASELNKRVIEAESKSSLYSNSSCELLNNENHFDTFF